MAKVSTWLRLRYEDGDVRVAGVSKKRPTAAGFALKLNIEIPDSAFERAANITVPEDGLVLVQTEVTEAS